MSIVAIAETAGSLGNEIGRKVAERVGYHFADREIIAKAAEQFGEDVTRLRHGTEEKPTLWERITDTQHRHLVYVEAVICEMAARDNAVLAGLASTLVLRRMAQVLRVRTTAPERVRADRVQQQQGLTPEAALAFVRQTDHERASRVRFLYQVDVDDPLLYDLVLNTERLTADEGARLVQHVLQGERFQAATLRRSELQDLGIMAQAKARFMAMGVSPRRVFVSSTRGYVSLSGSVDGEDVRRLAEETVTKISGVTGVLNEIIVIPRSTMPPAG